MSNQLENADHKGVWRAWKVLAAAGALALGVASAPFVATAQDAPAFSDVDSNVDGVISEDEYLAAFPEGTSESFVMADVNGDSVLTQDEYEAMAALMQR